MLLHLQKFDLDVFYRKGKEIHMADPLSWANLTLVRQDIVDNQEEWNVADTRSPVETDYVDMAESVTIRREQQKDPLKCPEIPARQWQSISADLLKFHGTQYLIWTDCYLNVFELDILTSTTTRAVINKLKPHLYCWITVKSDLPETVGK